MTNFRKEETGWTRTNRGLPSRCSTRSPSNRRRRRFLQVTPPPSAYLIFNLSTLPKETEREEGRRATAEREKPENAEGEDETVPFLSERGVQINSLAHITLTERCRFCI